MSALHAPNITNLRDLGGYPCADGKSLEKGHFFRSAGLSKLSEEDITILKELGLRIIVDLRSDLEVAKEPDIVPEFCDYYRYSGIVTMDDPNAATGDMDMKSAVMAMMQGDGGLPNPMDYLIDCYETMAGQSNAFRELFSLIINYPDKPLLFHCTAGKDRTGIAAALILLCLGAEEKTVMEDYLLSNNYRKAENESILAAVRSQLEDERVLAMMNMMLEVQPSFLKAFIEKVHALYGSWDNYFEQALGVSTEQRLDMQKRYLH